MALQLAHKEGWEQVYEQAKEFCAFPDAIAFLQQYPGAVNNKKPRSGWTILHQAMYWDVDKGVVECLKNCGADPNLRDRDGLLAVDRCQTEEQKLKQQAVLYEVFGNDDAAARLALLAAAKEGNFIQVLRQLKERPHLVNTQSHRGWSVLHQAAFHGVAQGLLAALLDMKASLELRTEEGKTAQDILYEADPGSPLRFPGVGAVGLRPGDKVLVHQASRSARAVVDRTANGEATVTLLEGETRGPTSLTVPDWRIFPLVEVPDESSTLHDECITCSAPVCSTWKLSEECTGPPHLMCGDCMALFLWAQFTSFRIPFKCGQCEARVDLAKFRSRITGRLFQTTWPPGRSDGKPLTLTDFDTFTQNVEERLRHQESAEFEAFKLKKLADCPCTEDPMAYCNVADCPKIRACPDCGVLIEYASDCKHMTCAVCRHRFCFLCLRTQDQHNMSADSEFDWSPGEACPIAPRQTSLPRREGASSPSSSA